MRRSFIQNVPLLIAGSLTCIFSLTMAILSFQLERMGVMVVFLAIAILFGWISLENGAMITMNSKGICRFRLGKKACYWEWDCVEEIGVCNPNLFQIGRDGKGKGFCYVYVSKEKLDDVKRFDMILRWPPRGKIYFLCDEGRMNAIRLVWDKAVVTYNAGDISSLGM